MGSRDATGHFDSLQTRWLIDQLNVVIVCWLISKATINKVTFARLALFVTLDAEKYWVTDNNWNIYSDFSFPACLIWLLKQMSFKGKKKKLKGKKN